jgi:cytochrome P450
MPVLSSLSGHEVNDIAQVAVGPRRCHRRGDCQLLARLEGETLLATFARAFARIEPDGEPTPLLNNTLRGWVRLPVIVTPA